MSLARFVLKRVAQGVGVVWGVITVVFALRFITPGFLLLVLAATVASLLLVPVVVGAALLSWFF